MVAVFAHQHVETPHLEIVIRLQAMALQPSERNQSRLWRVLSAYSHRFAAQLCDGRDATLCPGDDVRHSVTVGVAHGDGAAGSPQLAYGIEPG
jgi:hypothetical protein